MKFRLSCESCATAGSSHRGVERGVEQADCGPEDPGELQGKNVPGDGQEKHGRCKGVRRGTATRSTAQRYGGTVATWLRFAGGGVAHYRWRVWTLWCPLRRGGFARAMTCMLQSPGRGTHRRDLRATVGALFPISVAAAQAFKYSRQRKAAVGFAPTVAIERDKNVHGN